MTRPERGREGTGMRIQDFKGEEPAYKAQQEEIYCEYEQDPETEECEHTLSDGSIDVLRADEDNLYLLARTYGNCGIKPTLDITGATLVEEEWLAYKGQGDEFFKYAGLIAIPKSSYESGSVSLYVNKDIPITTSWISRGKEKGFILVKCHDGSEVYYHRKHDMVMVEINPEIIEMEESVKELLDSLANFPPEPL